MRILGLFLAFGPCFVILSISVEGLFYLAYSVLLAVWVEAEATVRNESGNLTANGKEPKEQSKLVLNTYVFRVDDVRIALFFLFFVQVGFFGTGKYVNFTICGCK